MNFDAIILGINGGLLIVVLFLSIRLINAASTFLWNNGDSVVQNAMKWRILKTLLLLLIIGMGAVFLNVIASWNV